MNKLLLHPRAPFAAAALVSLALVAGGVALAKLLNLAACPLCILQRMLYLLVAAVGILGLFADRTLARRLAALAMAAAAGTGAFVAGYQVWIQNFARETDCVANAPWWEQMVDWASERMPLLFGVSGLCSEPGWRLLGLTIAEWSLMAFAALAAAGLFAALRRAR
ncbi:MAG TPA: disulfide bond formation protein B [Rhodocyclaceae bacterium]